MAGVALDGDSEGITINLYPMLDVFSILIAFLLMNFSTAGESVESKPNLELPRSEVRLNLDAAANVSITKSEIIVQNGVSIPIGPDGDVPASYVTQGAIPLIFQEMKKVRAQNEILKNRDASLQLKDEDVNLLTLEADKQTTFRLIKRVMLSAEQAEFISWKLAVDRQNLD